jgi:hypothetical protein
MLRDVFSRGLPSFVAPEKDVPRRLKIQINTRLQFYIASEKL